MDWAHEFVEGNTRASCSVCGVSRRFPDNLTYCDDKLFRCSRCMEETPQARDRKIQSYRASAREEIDLGAGLLPRGEIPFTFLRTAQQRQAQLIPGWTPTTTFYDDFTIVPGGVGSSWTNTLTTSGTVTQPSAGVARFSVGATGGEARSHVATVAVPNPSAGNFYCACSFKTTSVSSDGSPGAFVGAATSAGASRSAFGVRSNAVVQPFYHLLTSVFTRLPVEVETSNYHLGEVWWKTGGAVFCSMDGGASINAPTSAAGSRLPFIQAINASVTLDVTDYVAMV